MTAPLLSPTDITPKIDFDEWLQTPLSDTRNTSTTAACADFAAAILNSGTSLFSIALPSPTISLSLPSRTLSPPAVSRFCSDLELAEPGVGITQFQSSSVTAAPAIDPSSDGFFSSFTEDMICEQQAYYNSWMDISSDYQTDAPESLDQAAYQSSHANTNFLAIDDTADALDLSFLSQSGPEPFSDTSGTLLAVVEEGWHRAIVTPPTTSIQSADLSSPQRMAISNHNFKKENDYEQVWDTRLSVAPSSILSTAVSNSSTSQRLRQGKSKPACGGAVVKKKQITFINHSMRSAGTVTTVDGPSPNRRHRRSLDDEERGEAAILRRIGVCQKCRKGRRKCKRHQARFLDLFSTNPYTLNLPCAHLKFEEARLFRLAPNKSHPMRCYDIVYQSTELSHEQYDRKRLHLTQDYGSELIIEVALFDPQPADKTAHMWHGERVELPPYCIVGIQQASEKMMEYVRNSRGNILLELLFSANDITREVLLQADRYQHRTQNQLVKQALDILTATRIIERDWHIHGLENLGIPAIHDPLHIGWPKIPVTPVMDGQLDQLVITFYLLPLRENFLANLQRTIYAGKKEDWFSIFLATFIYLTHIECLLQHSRRNAKRYGIKRRYNDINFAERYFEASRIALAHFHCVANAAMPLHLDRTHNDVFSATRLDDDEVAFMGNVRTKMEEKKRDGSFQEMKIKHQYEEPLYFCHQLSDEEWVAGVGKIVICEEVVM